MVEEAVATVEAGVTVEAGATVDMVEASVVDMAPVVAVILALAGGTTTGRGSTNTWIGSAIMGADWAVSSGINQLG
jgi:5-enolpyruvylshikimate-3-phosphate synthase